MIGQISHLASLASCAFEITVVTLHIVKSIWYNCLWRWTMNTLKAIETCMQEARYLRSAHTARNYNAALKHFIEFLKSKNIDPTSLPYDAIKIEHFINYIMWVAGQGFAKRSVGLFITGTIYFMNWLVLQGILNPTYTDVLRLKEARRMAATQRETLLPRFPKLDDVTKMIESVHSMPYKSPRRERNIAVIEFLASTGCRNDEICKLKIKDITDDCTSAIVMGKGRKERRVFINQKTRDALRNYWLVRGYREGIHPVFARHDTGIGKKISHLTTASIRDIVNEVKMASGIENFSPHYFRHAFAIKALRETGNLALVQDFLGHASPSATRVYAKIYPDDLAAAHQKIFG